MTTSRSEDDEQDMRMRGEPQPRLAEHRADMMQPRATTRSGQEDTLSLDELRLGKEIEAEHQLGLSNSIPLILVILPNLAAMFFDGEPESWRDSLIFLLIVFFLYKISKAPWQLYASARTTRILNQSHLQSTAQQQQQQNLKYHNKTIYPIRSDQFLTELNRHEMGFLLLATFSPAIGVGLLMYLQSKLDIGLSYLNSHSTLLYLLASLVKPLGHLHHRLLQRSSYLQTQLQFPVRLADQFNQTIDDLSFRLAELEGSSLSKLQLDAFRRTHIDTPLAALSDRLAKYQNNDELHQLRAASRLSGLEETLAQLVGQLEKAEQTLDNLIQQDQSLQSTPIHSLGKIVHQLLDPASSHLNADNRNNPPSAPFKSTHHIYPGQLRQEEWAFDPQSPGSLKQHLNFDTDHSREEHSRNSRNPGYYSKFMDGLLHSLSPQGRQRGQPTLVDKLSRRFTDYDGDQQRGKSGRMNMILKAIAWPIVMVVLVPLSFLFSATTRVVGVPVGLFRWAFLRERRGRLRRDAGRGPSAAHGPARATAARRSSPTVPRARHLRTRASPSSGSPGTSPDSLASSDISLLLDRHPPSSAPLTHKPKPRSSPWNASPGVYDPIDDHADLDRVSYQSHEHLF
ncbi:hypothetical protein PCASD_10650 [Puccinia coronata f. sp. avenae]|uniref:Uncharacterized protein n=1 Tax=Puccinia coronata f. sp. avenae TaxID=200324 RepID=A0A2N5TE91_9BASI|nr:hypothetical protein PCASD_10650 [Puccinia coronata f. sp. avenae]